VRKYVSTRAKELAMQAGVWHLGNYTFASGKKANNKFEIPELLNDFEAREIALHAMVNLVLQHSPDALWGVPAGGQEFARQLAKECELPVIYLKKAPSSRGTKVFTYENRYIAQEAQSAERVVGIEGITNELTSVVGALELPELREKTNAIVAFWRRGTSDIERPLDVNIEWVVEQEVPNLITPDHPFYQQYAHLAIRDAD
jgi:orotate phosphoribosyltransferase